MLTVYCVGIEEGLRQKRRQRSMLLLGELAAIAIFHEDDLTKRIYRTMATWQNGWFGKMDDHPIHTIPHHHHTKMDPLPKSFVL